MFNYLRLFRYLLIAGMVILALAACAGDSGGGDERDNNDSPGALSAPSDLQVSILDDDSVSLSWTDNANGEDGFEIQQSEDGVHFNVSYTVGGNTTNYTVDGLTSNVDYSFRVCAFDGSSDSAFSNIVVVTVGPLFNCEHRGTLTLHFTNDLPDIDETATVDVTMDQYGGVFFGSAILSYDAQETQGDFRIQRTGSLNIDPDGWYNDANPTVYIEVDENTTYQETLQTWYRDNGGQWQQVLNESLSGLWDGGLAFDFSEVIASGSSVSVVTGQGSAVWTLQLTPALVP